MSKLFKLKEWLLVSDAAKRLTITFGEAVTEADVLRLALDGHLRLSVNFVNEGLGIPGTEVPIEEAQFKEVPTLNLKGTIRLYKGPTFFDQNGDARTVLELEDEPARLVGVYDLPMIGGERLDVENRFQVLTSGPTIDSVSIDGAFVVGHGKRTIQVQTPFVDRGGHYPASALPEDCVLVVRTAELMAFEQSVNSVPAEADRALLTTERNTLLKLVIGMAMKGYRHNPAAPKSPATKEIADDLAALGIGLSDDTVRKYLKDAAGTVLPAKDLPAVG